MDNVVMYHAFHLPFFLATVLTSLAVSIRPASENMALKPFGYEYQDFLLDDLALKAKIDEGCLNEVLNRFLPTIYQTAALFEKMYPYLDHGNLISELLATVRKGVELFDPGRGQFEHLVRRMFRLTLLGQRKATAIEYQRQLRYLGGAIQALNDEESDHLIFQDCICDDEDEECRQRLDLEQYREELTSQEKGILDCFLQHYSYAEIAKKYALPRSTVSYKVTQMIAELSERHKRKLI